MHEKGNVKKLTYFFIKKYNQPLCLNNFSSCLFAPFCGYFPLFVGFALGF